MLRRIMPLLFACVLFFPVPAQALQLRDRIRERVGAFLRDDAPDETAAARSRTIRLRTAEGERRYLLHVPPGMSRWPLPLIVALHGYGSNPRNMERMTGFSTLADQEGFVVAYPLGAGQKPQWRFMGRDDHDIDFIRAMVGAIGRRVSIDQRRIYVAGISNGAQMSWRLGCVAPDLFAAIGVVAGNYPRYEDCDSSVPLPAVIFHGTADDILHYGGRFVQFGPQQFAADRARQNGCAAQPVLDFQKGEVSGLSWQGCRNNAAVALYTINGKGHSWPGTSYMPEAITTQTIDASDMIWDFFRLQAR